MCLNRGRRRGFTLLYVLLVNLISTVAHASAAANVADRCDRQWVLDAKPLSLTETRDAASLLSQWTQHEHECAGTVVYEARLALIYWKLDRLGDAKATIEPYLAATGPYAYLIELVDLMIDFKRMSLPGASEPDRSTLVAYETRLRDYQHRYPDQKEIDPLLGTVQLGLGENDVAVQSFRRAIHAFKGTSQEASVYRGLVVALSRLDANEDAYEAAGHAIALDKSLFGDTEFMLAAVRATVKVERFEAAQTMLQVLNAKVPGVKDTPAFIATVNFVRAEYKKFRASQAPTDSLQ